MKCFRTGSVALVLTLQMVAVSPAADPAWVVRGKSGVVASDSRQASQAGLSILKSGGNAVDAAVAVSFALAVTRPYSTGFGGGGFMIARFADSRVFVQDFRETAPAAATGDLFVKARERNASAAPPSRFGYLAAGVPGLVAGRCQALAQMGTISLEMAMAPAIHLARDGYPVDPDYVKNSHDVMKFYEKYPALKKSCGYVFRTHMRGGRIRRPGDKLVQPELARLLQGVAKGGAEFFYKGPVAKAIATAMRSGGGLITESDLAGYAPIQRKPIVSTFRDYEVIGMPPPSSGGVALAETLNVLEASDLAAIAKRYPGLAVHQQIEAMKHAFADRSRWLGDSDFVTVPTKLLTSKDYGQALAKLINPDWRRNLDAYGLATLPDDAGTSHFCVADRWGNVVVSTETINTTFGSLAAVDEWGLIFNNQMDDFTAEPGKPNAFGLVQSEQNAVAPGKRPLSSMTPTIVMKDGKPFLLVGASGGPRIISSVLNVILGVTEFDLTLEQAMLRLRPHHQWRPDQVYFDVDAPATIVKKLADRGHTMAKRHRSGVVQAILKTPDGWVGASDPKKGGRPAGY